MHLSETTIDMRDDFIEGMFALRLSIDIFMEKMQLQKYGDNMTV